MGAVEHLSTIFQRPNFVDVERYEILERDLSSHFAYNSTLDHGGIGPLSQPEIGSTEFNLWQLKESPLIKGGGGAVQHLSTATTVYPSMIF